MRYDAALVDDLDRRAPSMVHLFLRRVQETPDGVAFAYPSFGRWQTSTWSQTERLVAPLAAGLVELGVEPEEPVALVAGTRYEWVLCDLAVMRAGGATTTVHPGATDDDLAHVIEDSGARVVVVEDIGQIQRLWRVRNRIRHVEQVILIDGDFPDDRVLTLEGLLRLGQRRLEADPQTLSVRLAGVRRDSLATIQYTAGTNGTPRGVRLRHSSLAYQGAAVASLGLLGPDDLQYLWLPLSQAFGRALLATQLVCGFPTAIDGSVERIFDNLAVLRPTFMAGVPQVFERARARILASIAEETPVRRYVVDRAFTVARRVRTQEEQGEPVSALLAGSHRVLDHLVLGRIRSLFGDRMRFCLLGAGSLDPEIHEFFAVAGLSLLQGYGLTETVAGATADRPELQELGLAGLPLPGTELDLAPDGEILLAGPAVMAGYQGSPLESARALRHGWLHTGDLGELDDQGRLRVVGRVSEVFTTAHGTRVVPGPIEGALKAACPLVSHAVVLGAGRPYCAAVVAVDPDAVERWARHQGLAHESHDVLVRAQEVYDLVGACIAQVNAGRPPGEAIRRFVIADSDFTLETGELTPSLTVRRHVVEARYAERIRSLFPAPGHQVRELHPPRHLRAVPSTQELVATGA